MKIDWTAAKKDYISDQKLSHTDIAQKYGVSVDYVSQRAAKEGWSELRREITEKSQEKLSEILPEQIARYKAKKFTHGEKLSNMGMKVLENKEEKITPKTANEIIANGYKLQDEALGLDKPQTQVNIQNNTFLSVADFGDAIKKRIESDNK